MVVSAVVLGESSAASAAETVLIDFEDVTGGTLAKVPSGTGHLDWDNMVATEYLLYESEGTINGATSGHYAGYNGSGHPVAISRKGGFDFVGGYFGAGWLRAEGEELLLEAWRDDTRVGEEAIGLSAMGPVWFDADYRDITRLVLKTRHYWQFVADDMVFRVPPGEQ